MKKKIMAMALVVCLLVVAVGGATLAYFTAENTADNVFTMKGINIEVVEDFVQNSELVPGLDINKDVYVKNTGTSDAYVRVHIAIPEALDDGNPTFAAVNNFLHFNFTNESVEAGQWSWTPEMTDGTGYLGNGAGNWNYYTQTIDGVDYGVYVVTYRTALAGGEQTATAALDKVYVDPSVDCTWDEENQCFVYADDKGNTVAPTDFGTGDGNLMIKVWAEAAQTATFTDAYDALNTAFGVPGTYNPWA
ncbi:MAG: BsaA family SipW-dependent biofilm matrix protein [Firmicutes bacterium]|nr:BsaA family SipW-dependent biofilm matrix protein [Bacillota bacterium]